ncbi:MAG: zinc ribbon domain-containing protein [Anaerolineae bacterium]
MPQQCPHCGQSIRFGAKFCPGCGHSVASISSGGGQAPPISQTRNVVRIMSFGEILGSSVRLFVRYFFRLLLASLVGYAVWALATILIGVVLAIPLSLAEIANPWLNVLTKGLAVLLIILPTAIISAPLTLAVSSLVVADRLSYSGLVAGVFSRRLVHLLLTVALQSLLILLGCLLIIPGIYLTVVFSMTPAAVMLEDQVGWAALRRSRELVYGYWFKTFGLLLASLLIPIGIIGAMLLIITVRNVGGLIVPVVLLLTMIALPCFSAVVQVLLYYDLRSRRGNFSVITLATTPTVQLIYERI